MEAARVSAFSRAAQMVEPERDGFEATGQIPDHQTAGENLADDGGQRRTGHAHVQHHDKNGVQHGVDDRAAQRADHGHLGAAVGPDQVAAAGGQDQKRKAEGGDAHVALGVGEHIVRGAEGLQ